MENYKLKQRLGKGAQGSVFLVENKLDGKQYVLKKVECNDESEANKAFKEAMALQDLRHPYVCGYKEFFVTWDKQESAMFVCIVMEYYKLGDLDKVLKQKRSKQEFIDEMVLKKWLGQMLDALVFVHRKKVIHRDLKPSNIFLTEGLNISIGDFGVATIMDDARTRTRTTVGTMNWMAPEVLERPYDERSDVWSLGCILLELATTGYLDTAQMSSTLFQIKQSPQVLEEVLDKVAKKYKNGKELCQIIRIMLRRNFQQRPSALELCELPYLKESMALSGTAATNTNSDNPEKAKPVPKNKGIAGVLSYMKDNKSSPVCQVEALRYLTTLTAKGDVSFNETAKKTICQTMKDNLVVLDIQVKACQLLVNIIPTIDEKDVLYTSIMILPVLLAMRSHGGSVELQKVGCQLIMALSADESAAEVIGTLGGVQDVLAALRLFPNDAELAISVCGAVWSLAVNENNCKIVTEERGLQDICAAMECHESCVDLVESACSALWSLSMEDDNIEMMNDSNTVGLLVDSIKTHMKVAKVVKNACMALASIVEADESCAYQVLNSGGDIGGAPLLVQASKIHQDDEEVMENACALFCELSEYDEICTELNSLDVKTILKNAKKKYSDNQSAVMADDGFSFVSDKEVVVSRDNRLPLSQKLHIDLVTAVLNALTRLGGGQRVGNRAGSARSRPRTPLRK